MKTIKAIALRTFDYTDDTCITTKDETRILLSFINTFDAEAMANESANNIASAYPDILEVVPGNRYYTVRVKPSVVDDAMKNSPNPDSEIERKRIERKIAYECELDCVEGTFIALNAIPFIDANTTIDDIAEIGGIINVE